MQIGSAVVTGVVTSDENPARPVPRAIVTLAGTELGASRGAITDDAGRFRFEGLPAGRYTLKTEKPGFITAFHGAKRPARPGTAIVVRDAERLAELKVTLWRGAVIAGTIRDDLGRAAAGVVVRAIRDENAADRVAPVLTNNGATTDARGQYRIFGLEPGSYVLSARMLGGAVGASLALADQRVDELLAMLQKGQRTGFASTAAADRETTTWYAPVFYPGTVGVEQARVIALAAGEEIAGIDLALQAIPVSTLSGTVRLANGSPAAGATILLTRMPKPAIFRSVQIPNMTSTAASDGTFSVGQVTPGTYRVTVRYRPPPPRVTTGDVQVFAAVGPDGATLDSSGQTLWAAAEIAVSSADISGVALTVGPGVTLRGNVTYVRDGVPEVPPPPNAYNIFFNLQSTTTGINAFTETRPDGTFLISGPPSDTFRLTVNARELDSSWALGSVLGPGGADWYDAPFALSGEAQVNVTYTNRRTELSGRVQAAGGAPISDVFIIAFSADRRFWGIETRRVQAVRPGADGAFALKDLPPGEYFLGALTDVDPGDWLRPGFLDAIVSASTKVTLAEGGKTVQNLQIGGRSARVPGETLDAVGTFKTSGVGGRVHVGFAQ